MKHAPSESRNQIALAALQRLAKDDPRIAAAVLKDFGKPYDKLTGNDVRNTLDPAAFRSLVDNSYDIYRTTGINRKRTMKRSGKP